MAYWYWYAMFFSNLEWLLLAFLSVVTFGAYAAVLLNLRRAQRLPSRVLDRHNSSLLSNLIQAAMVGNTILPVAITIFRFSHDIQYIESRPLWASLMVYIIILTEGMHCFVSVVVAKSIKLKL